MIKLKRKLSVVTLATALFVGVIGFNTVFATGNVNNTYWSFTFGGANTDNQRTEYRTKYDATSVWMQVTKDYNRGTSTFKAYVIGPNNQDYTVSPVQFSGVVTHYIPNWAYEYNNNSPVSVCIKGVAPYRSGANWHTLGWWSPDSV